MDCHLRIENLGPQLQSPVGALLGATVDNGIVRQTRVGGHMGGRRYGAVLCLVSMCSQM
jgi:hypothetical protein